MFVVVSQVFCTISWTSPILSTTVALGMISRDDSLMGKGRVDGFCDTVHYNHVYFIIDPALHQVYLNLNCEF